MKKIFSIVASAAVAFSALAQQAPISVRWEMVKNGAEKGFYSSRFVIKNVSEAPLEKNWQFYFNQFSRRLKLADSLPVDIKEVSTSYYQVTPNARYRSLAPGDSMVVEMMMRGTMVNICYTPMGGHVVMNGDTKKPMAVNIDIAPLDHPDQYQQRPNDYPDGNRMWAFNETLKNAQAPAHCYDAFPTPKSVALTGGFTQIGNVITLKANCKAAKRYLTTELNRRGIYATGNPQATIELKLVKHLAGEAYEMVVNDGHVTISAGTTEGCINGAKTLISALDHSTAHSIENAVIKDSPDFGYRGFMLDVSRNFTTFENMKRVIDLLAYYKLNVLHLHFSDDEAWRIEIPGLPELTEVAARRGCTLDEKEHIASIFDGNGNPDDLSQSANGYYTRSQMIEMLKYATERGVKIIPEIETPAHARAALVAMKARYAKYIGTDKAMAEQYKMWDDNDKSVYTSAQSYHDNVLNVAHEGVFNFIYKVVDELEAMWKDAGLKLDIVHLGGDEVPKGSWDASPDIQALMQQKGLKNAHEVSEYFIRRVSEHLALKGIKAGGWQEVGLDHPDAHNATVAPRFAMVNAWSTVGSRANVPYLLANAGYPTILSNVTNFYVDMAYSWHQYDKGLHWGGVCDEYAAWFAQPFDVYRSERYDYNGLPLDVLKAGEGKTTLEKPENIIGVQGQLWSETIRNFDQVQYYMLPKIFGLALRGWNAKPEWDDAQPDTYIAARANFNAKAARELAVLHRHGYNFRLGLPGAKIDGGMLVVNTQYPGEMVRYTLDGSEPTQLSPLWTAPVAVDKSVKLIKVKAYYLGKESLSTYLWP
ncbi:MAG: family 20 glycosylhydrolase [Bacteroidales bacterium]|nr:family 20 glycosylhydrolase [Bacteroidales bacterium]